MARYRTRCLMSTFYLTLAGATLGLSYTYMEILWTSLKTEKSELFTVSNDRLYNVYSEKIKKGDTNCSAEAINEWSERILNSHSVKGGLQELRKMALELTVGMGRLDEKHRKLSNLIIDVNSALKRAQARKWITAPKTQCKISQNFKSLGFIKAYKVAGTHISSLLMTIAYTYDLNVNPAGQWYMTEVNEGKYDSCIDVAGIHHPLKNFHKSATQNYTPSYFCTDHVTFMFVRDPVQRIWSAYNHYRNMFATSLASFLLKKPQDTITPPHMLLSPSLQTALKLAQNITILSSDHMEVSLVLLATKTGMSMCDILSTSCESKSSNWDVSKCNTRKINLTNKTLDIIRRHINATNEGMFYNKVIQNFTRDAADPVVQHRLTLYLNMKAEASKACSSDLSYKAYENVFYADPKVRFLRDHKYWALSRENYHAVVPTWLCMQAYCRSKKVGEVW